jgi:thiamine-phosphate pyrophosphorylase
MKQLPRLYAIADASFGDPVKLAEALFEGGARLVQVRNKNASARDALEQVERILALAPPDALVLVNDRVDIALISGAAGVHLGQTDVPPKAAREILGPNRIIGISTHNLQQAMDADGQPVDYVALGPIFATTTKSNPDPVVGVELLRAASQILHRPLVAIGGITMRNIGDVLDAGAGSLAVIRDLLDTTNVAARTRQWLEILKTRTL